MEKLRIIQGEHPQDIKVMLGERDLLEELAISSVKIGIEPQSHPTATLEVRPGFDLTCYPSQSPLDEAVEAIHAYAKGQELGSFVMVSVESIDDLVRLYREATLWDDRFPGDHLTPFRKFTPEEAWDFCNAAVDGKVQTRSGFRMITEPDPED